MQIASDTIIDIQNMSAHKLKAYLVTLILKQQSMQIRINQLEQTGHNETHSND